MLFEELSGSPSLGLGVGRGLYFEFPFSRCWSLFGNHMAYVALTFQPERLLLAILLPSNMGSQCNHRTSVPHKPQVAGSWKPPLSKNMRNMSGFCSRRQSEATGKDGMIQVRPKKFTVRGEGMCLCFIRAEGQVYPSFGLGSFLTPSFIIYQSLIESLPWHGPSLCHTSWDNMLHWLLDSFMT